MESVASGKSLYGIAGTMVMSEGVLVNSTKKKKRKKHLFTKPLHWLMPLIICGQMFDITTETSSIWFDGKNHIDRTMHSIPLAFNTVKDGQNHTANFALCTSLALTISSEPRMGSRRNKKCYYLLLS